MKAKIAILPGDGVGPEIVAEAVKILESVARRFGHDFEMAEHPVGGAAYDRCGDCLPVATLAACKAADAVLLGAVGGPKWDALAPEKRPERRALLTLRAELGLFANLRPAKVWDALQTASPLLRRKRPLCRQDIRLRRDAVFGARNRTCRTRRVRRSATPPGQGGRPATAEGHKRGQGKRAGDVAFVA